jgi:hypothetical protein
MKWLADDPRSRRACSTGRRPSPRPGEHAAGGRAERARGQGRLERPARHPGASARCHEPGQRARLPLRPRGRHQERPGAALALAAGGQHGQRRACAGAQGAGAGHRRSAVVRRASLRKLPKEARLHAEELEGYATRMGQMTPSHAAVREQLAPRAGTIGDRDSASSSARVASDERSRTSPQDRRDQGPRWGKTKTVGDVAEEAVDRSEATTGTALAH